MNMDQRPHIASGGGAVVPEQGPRQAPYYYDYPGMSAMQPSATYAPTQLQAPAYYPTQHAPLLEAGGLGDPTCGVAAAMWNGTPGNPYGSPSSSSSFTSGGAHPSYFAGYDYYVCNNMAFYPQSNMTPPGAMAAPPPDYQHPHHHSAPPQLAHALSSPPYCYAPHHQSHSSCNGNELASVNGVNPASGEVEQGVTHDNRRPMFHATASPSQISYSSSSLKKPDRQLMNAPNHMQHLYSTPVDTNSLVNTMQQMSLQNAAAVAVAAAATASISSSSQPPPTPHSNYRSGLNGPHHQDSANGTRGNLASHTSSSQSSSVQTCNAPSQQTRNLANNGAYMAATSNSGSAKSWACIAGQPPRGSAATLGNSIVSGIGATTMINGNGYPVNPSPEEEQLNSHVIVKEDVNNAVQRQSMYSSSVYNGRDQQPTAPTPPAAHNQFHRQNGTGSIPHSAPDYNFQTRTAAIFSEPNNFGTYGNAHSISTALPQTEQFYVPPARSVNMTTQIQPVNNFLAHETSYNLEEAKKLLNTLHVSLNRPDFDFESIKLARVFVIKSFSEEDVHRSMKYGVWCSTERGNERLHQAYVDMQARGGRVFLCFSVNGSGHFCGFCEMISGVNMEKRCGIWADPRWRGELRVQWNFVKDVPNSELRHIRVESNDNKSVTNSRDCTEVTPLEKGLLLMRLIAKFKHRTCFLDDFLHYEMKEIDMRANNQLIANPRS